MTNARISLLQLRDVMLLLAAASVVVAVALSSPFARAADENSVNESGLHSQPWFHESFLDLGEDLKEAAAEGKGLAIFVEQAGCPYCRELHRVTLADPAVAKYIKANFVSVQLDLRGAREVTDFDGEAMEERKLVRRWGLAFTPTVLLFHPDAAEQTGKIGRQRASATIPGYFKPFHFATMLEFVRDGHFKSKHFQDFVNERARRLREQGKTVTIW